MASRRAPSPRAPARASSPTRLPGLVLLLAALAFAACAPAGEAPSPELRRFGPVLAGAMPFAVTDPGPPACPEALDAHAGEKGYGAGGSGPWPPAPDGEAGLVRVLPPASPEDQGRLAQRLAWGEGVARQAPLHRLRFLGAHLFDLLNKIDAEGGDADEDRRRLVCASLAEAASRGASVVRIWGTLKRVGEPGEIDRAARALALALDENARRSRPLRFVVVLANHQAGYGAPEPSRSLDDQAPGSPFSARRFYLEGGWRAALAPRIERYAAEPALARSPYVLAWELVNELDLFRSIGAGDFGSEDAERLREGFAVPALSLLAERFPQPLALGDLRGRAAEPDYPAFARALAASLPEAARARLLWTSHVYADVYPAGRPVGSPARHAAHFDKLDRDLAIARDLGLPFYVGEVGQHLRPFEGGFCRGPGGHAPRALFAEAFGEGDRRGIEMAFFWGEGQCALEVPSAAGVARIAVGAGGDAADLSPSDAGARAEVAAERRRARWSPQPLQDRALP